MDDSESTSSFHSGIPLYRSVSVSKNTQTEDTDLYALPDRNDYGCCPGPESNMYFCQMSPDVWRANNCMPLYPNYVTTPPFTFCQFQASAGSMCHFSMPWYPIYCGGYVPMNIIPSQIPPLPLQVAAPSQSAPMHVIMPPCSDVQSRVSTNNTLSRTNSDTGSVITSDKDVVSRISECREGKPLRYYKIVDEKHFGRNPNMKLLKRLEHKYLKPRNCNDVQYNCSTDTVLNPEAQNYESSLSTSSSWDNETSQPIKLNIEATKRIQRKPRSRFSTGVDTNTTDIVSSTDIQNSYFNRKGSVTNHSEGDEIKRQHPIVKRYINKNLMNKISDIDYDRDSQKSPCKQSETGLIKKKNLDEEKLEVSRNVHRLANLLCDFNASCGDPSDQYYNAIIRKSIEKALHDGIERNDAFVCNKIKVHEREPSENMYTVPSQQIYTRDIGDRERRLIHCRDSVTRDTSFKPDDLPTALNRRKMKLVYNSPNGFQDDEILCLPNSSSNTNIEGDKNDIEYQKMDESRSPSFGEIINPKLPELKMKSINTTESHCKCGLKPYQYQSTSNKLDATSSSSLSSTNYSCETTNSQNSSYRPSSNERASRSCESNNYGRYQINDDKNMCTWSDNLSDSGHSVSSRKSDFNDNQPKTIQKVQQLAPINNSNLRYTSFEMPVENCQSKTTTNNTKNTQNLTRNTVSDNNNSDASSRNRYLMNLQYCSLPANDRNDGNNCNNLMTDFSRMYNVNFYCDTGNENNSNTFPCEYYKEGQVMNRNESVTNDRYSIDRNQYMQYQQQYQEYIQQQQACSDLDNSLARKQKRYNHLSILNNIETLSVISEADEENVHDMNSVQK